MPNRILRESFLDSRSMEVLSPRAQDAFPRFILLADDFGCFEVNPRILWAKGWARRPDVTEADVGAWLLEYAEKQAVDPDTGKRLPPVLMLWTNAGRRYAHLTGWHGPHGQARRVEYDPNAPKGTPGRHGSKRKTPPPPADILAAVLAGEVRAIDGKPPGTDREPDGNEESENPSDSTPAREITGTPTGATREVTVSRSFPGPAVPVPVADPVAVLATTPAAPPPGGEKQRTRKPKPAESDPRFQPFVRLAFDVFAEKRDGAALDFDGHDGKSLREFLGRQPKVAAEEFGRRWGRALDLGAKWPGCASIAHLVERWNELAPGGAEAQGPKRNHGMLPVGKVYEGKPW
jgi:hypothetical protein